MHQYYIGVDGGGSKTLFGICNEKGGLLGTVKAGSTSYKQYGHDGMFQIFRTGIEKLLIKSGAEFPQISGVCFGMPCFGENSAEDKKAASLLQSYFESIPVKIVNDVEASWAGSLLLQEGVSIVAGTGSMAFGRDRYKNSARTGGWSEYFGDEGSGYYLGRKLVEIFTKQADGRLPKSHVYTMTKERLKIDNDFDIIAIAEKYIFKRDKLAGLQIILSDAAKAGDESAIAVYREAGRELAALVLAIRDKLRFDGRDLQVSYSGGIFNNNEMVLNIFREILTSHGFVVKKPAAEPFIGSILLAAESFGREHLEDILQNIHMRSGPAFNQYIAFAC